MNTPAQNAPSAADRTAALAQAITGTVRMARALVGARRAIDLHGLDQETGRLCAAALDLPPAEGRAMRPTLAVLLSELDALSAALAAAQDERP